MELENHLRICLKLEAYQGNLRESELLQGPPVDIGQHSGNQNKLVSLNFLDKWHCCFI
jgi:hypothetical protein